MEQMNQMSQRSEDKHLPQLNEIQIGQALNDVESNCSLKTVEFIKSKTSDLRDLKTNDNKYQLLGVLITKISNLGGFKNVIDDINKQDIFDLISLRYLDLSLQEIYYAFQLERFGSLDPRTEHYQLFNAEYFSKVLNKFKKWRANEIKTKNIKLMEEEEVSGPTPEETKKIVDKQITEMVMHYTNTKEIKLGCLHLYMILFERGVLPEHTSEYKETVRTRAIDLLSVNKKNANSLDQMRKIQHQMEGRDSISHLFREIVLKDYLKEATK